jgi:type II secretory pathway predicted ATPase ExeA
MLISVRLHSSIVIDHLSSKFANDTICIAYVYCDYRDNEKQSALNMIGSLLKQAMVVSRTICDDFIDSFLEKKKKQMNVEIDDALQALSKILQRFKMTYICVDALDGCLEEHRWNLIRRLKGLATYNPEHPVGILLFFTGRPQIKDYINLHPDIGANGSVSIKFEATSDDIAAYIQHRLEMDSNSRIMDDEFKKLIVAEIVATSQGM